MQPRHRAGAGPSEQGRACRRRMTTSSGMHADSTQNAAQPASVPRSDGVGGRCRPRRYATVSASYVAKPMPQPSALLARPAWKPWYSPPQPWLLRARAPLRRGYRV